ncbi:MAG: DUF4351 domain-containing protein [Cyanobacteria bacterium J06641_5]
MLGIATAASQTRVFQEGRAEGRAEGEQTLILKQLERKVGLVSPELVSRITSLPIEKLEALGEALLGFETTNDLVSWLQTNALVLQLARLILPDYALSRTRSTVLQTGERL